MPADLTRRLTAEALGTAILTATVFGSGMMAARLTSDAALQLLVPSLTTGAILAVLITALGPVSGAHVNPVVTLAAHLSGGIGRREALAYAAAQTAGALAGTVLAHAMFARPLVSIGVVVRTGPALWLSEGVATFGLILIVLATVKTRPSALAGTVGLYVLAGYWFTASTGFTNPAVTLARALTDSGAGMRPGDVPAYVVAQLVGGALGALFAGWLLSPLPREAS